LYYTKAVKFLMTNVTELFSLKGKVAAVIGGTGVLGAEFCRGLADAGAAVAVLGRSDSKAAALAEELRGRGARALGIPLDATQKGELEAAGARIRAELGPVEILINAPGVNSATPFFAIGEEEWDRILDTNLKSCFLACQVFGMAMQEAGRGGSIINISSVSSDNPLSKVLTYSLSKAALDSMTRWLAREFAPFGVRVNSLAPGFFPAEQNRKILAPERVEAILRHTPMGRLGEPRELVGTVIWLASDRASGFVTGAVVRVDGGFTAMSI
jgi:NAD(P)-dependent dehydrogenase (short-subunit alcohol dehydrogenase family)